MLSPIIGAAVALYGLGSAVLNALGYREEIQHLRETTTIAAALHKIVGLPLVLALALVAVGVAMVAAPGVASALRESPRPRLSGFVRWVQVNEEGVNVASPDNAIALGFSGNERIRSCMIMVHIRNTGTQSVVYFKKATVSDSRGHAMLCITAPNQANFMPFPAMPVLSMSEAETTPIQQGDGGNVYITLLIGGGDNIDTKSLRAYFTDVEGRRFICHQA